ncbi:GGDEF domain-containing response regulator [Psychrosphaera aestuarii]|uniref:GGDEF domain-containing response regulator n=1 Tax=Psychrosphaera aestuarii TaxID=1266052 RepID=UPI001B33DD3D|nr:diguanylate cyclase [Psychrosphaera aestuarii]
MKVLIVDDDPIIRLLLVNNLKQWGHEPIDFDSAEQALAVIESDTDINILITDWSLPNMSGIDLCAHIREKSKRHIYIIMVTKKVSDEELHIALANGVDDFVTKPFGHNEMWLRLRAGERIIQHLNTIDQMATTDELTGMKSRRALLEQMKSEWQRTLRYENNCVVCLIDIDNLKGINDKFGKEVGDQVLIKCGRLIQDVIRVYDVVGRYTDDSFVTMFPKTKAPQGYTIAERIRHNISTLSVDGLGSEMVGVTVSIGLTKNVKDDITVIEMLNRADEAMEIAKKQGRNRIVCCKYTEVVKNNEKSHDA